MCSMSLTVVVSARWNWVSMRPAIWSGGRPVYCQITAMTGMRMSGKMSTGVRNAASGPTIRMVQRQHDERVGPPQRDADNADHAASALESSDGRSHACGLKSHPRRPPQIGRHHSIRPAFFAS